MRLLVSALFLVLVVNGCGSRQEGADAPDPTPPEPPPTAVDEPAPADGPEPEVETRIVAGTDPCTSDADCVPNGCCHPATCVARGHEPTCDGVCTTDCRYGTLDCGGACLCQGGVCAARLSMPPAIPGVGDSVQ